MVKARGLGYRLSRGREILAGIDLALAPGSFLAVVGENGADYRPGIAYAIFPAGCLLAVLWTRHNRRRWCVTF